MSFSRKQFALSAIFVALLATGGSFMFYMKMPMQKLHRPLPNKLQLLIFLMSSAKPLPIGKNIPVV